MRNPDSQGPQLEGASVGPSWSAAILPALLHTLMGPLGIWFAGFLTSAHREGSFRDIPAQAQDHGVKAVEAHILLILRESQMPQSSARGNEQRRLFPQRRSIEPGFLEMAQELRRL